MPIRFASEAWPRPGLAEPRSASIAGFGNTEPLSSREQKGKDFFSSGAADHALRLGPYMRRSCLRKLLHGHRWSHAAWQIIKTRTPPKKKGKTQIPQPDLRLTIQKTAKQTAKGARAQQKQPQKICQGHSGKNPLCRN